MGKSVFLMPHKNKLFNQTLIRKIRDEIRNGLLLEGPFSDRNGAVKELAEHIKSRVKFGHTDIVNAVFSSLVPQNLPKCLRKESWLRVPFLFGNAESDPYRIKDCSGDIASSATVDYKDGLARVADFDELTLLTVSLLRSLDIESYYTIIHFDEGPLKKLIDLPEADSHLLKKPCVVIPNNRTLSLGMLYPPFYTSSLDEAPISSLEVLDQDAITSLILFKQAKVNAQALMDDIARRKPDFPNEGELRSMQIGHNLFEGEMLWKPQDVEWSISLANLMFGGEFAHKLESMRDVAQKEHVHDLRCPTCHSMSAADKLLCSKAKREIIESIQEMSGIGDLFESLVFMVQHECTNRFKIYLEFAFTMNEHIHPPSECASTKDAN